MFGQQLASDVQQYLERLEKQRQLKVGADEASAGLTMGGDALRVPFLDFATATPKRHQTVVPGVGTLHDCCEHSPLFSAVARRLLFNSLVPAQLKGRDFGGDHTAKLEFLAPELVRAVARLRFKECAPADVVPQRNAYYSVLNTFQALHRSEAFRQLVHFVRDFAQLLKTSFRASSLTETAGPPKKRAKVDVATHGRTYGTLELFQKMILMHATYFLAAVLLGDHAEQVNTFLRLVFEIPLFSDAAVRHFRQRATVFLVPRRHGKTWFLVPLIALSLASFRGIKIGYTAHIRKATEPVFEEIDACLRGWFGSARVDHVKGETISFSFPDGSRSTIVFASSHNTNGIRGQDFNLLFVDEANFIRPDAVQTIMGFLNQANCKIIFVSSTNTGKASTSFLYNLRGAADELLNVVTYICDDHMPRVVTHTNATACSCYILNKPVFITMDGAVRRTADLFLADSFMQEIIGGQARETGDDRPVLTKSAGERFLLYRPSTTTNSGLMAPDLYVYVDPAFTANTRASGTGVAVVGRYRDDYIIFALEHFFLRALTGSAPADIARCVVHSLTQVLALHPGAFRGVRVAVEGNSSQDSAVAIATHVHTEMHRLLASEGADAGSGPELLFYHCEPPGSAVLYPFFLLNKQKTPAFEHFIKKFNSGGVMASQEIVSATVRLQTDPVEYLLEQLNNLTETVSPNTDVRTYSGKRNGASDDLMVAVIMAIYLAAQAGPPHTFAPITRVS
ncbi:DNA packaging terminase subunit 1 [Human alphaherpesvirus 1]|uniref:DNA packaging terminase subunit 1 n=1 Tax=Human herpesvirus 1 TaxID=10298 RepID=F8RDB2_HHV1|nr:DNA packaging terminase subunit 1 [Human alphaherpesvirus 1]ADM23405.1 DNA packaging terminase subunit 1 [Human alphaherpesvirus 1]AMN09785.1 DNA packaging terminase subunit 1 [Human alphaherpesvirus 1]AUF73379.1 UL15 [Human alphaherpesvirus 1]QAU09816.1 UL15 [Human alphaherpesvirus 1]